MQIDSLPRISLRPNISLNADSSQSLLISLLRGMAALQVAMAHLRAETFPGLRGLNDAPLAYQGLAFATGFAHQAVVVFFLISGWLVGGSLLNKWSQPHALGSYLIDRISRLWTVLIPTFVLMLFCAKYVEGLTPMPSPVDGSNAYSTVTLLGNLFGLQTISVPNFGRNYALWSLANETWYYLLFPLLLLVLRCKPIWQKGLAALAIAAIAAYLPMAILTYFSLWLLGAGFALVRIDCGPLTRLALLTICATLSIYFRLTGSNADLVIESYLQDLVCSVPLLLLLASMHRRAATGSAAMRHVRATAHTLSEFSFTLYVTHVPAIALMRHLSRTYLDWQGFSPQRALDYFAYFGAASLLVALAFILYLVFEAHTFRVRRYLKDKLLHRLPSRSAIVTAAAK